MKRALKIKAFLVFFAWGIVFVHGIIPHIHLGEQHGYCQNLLHDVDAGEHGNNGTDHFKGVHSEHEKVCHFPTTMYQQQGFDELLANTSQRPQIIPCSNLLSLIETDQVTLLSHSDTGPSLLRAPPEV